MSKLTDNLQKELNTTGNPKKVSNLIANFEAKILDFIEDYDNYSELDNVAIGLQHLINMLEKRKKKVMKGF